MGATLQARDLVNYWAMTTDQLLELWDLSQLQRCEILTAELVEEFTRRSNGPAPVVHDMPGWLYAVLRLFSHQASEGGQKWGAGRG